MDSPPAPSSEPSRKRPRLESSRSTRSPSFAPSDPQIRAGRSMSADRALSGANQPAELDRNFLESQGRTSTPPHIPNSKQTPVTINIRIPKQKLNGTVDPDEVRRDSHVTSFLEEGDKESGSQSPEMSNEAKGSVPSPPSSPEIELVLGELDDLEDDSAVVAIHIDGVEDDLTGTMLSKFPYSQNQDNATAGAKLYLDHLDNDHIDLNAIDLLRAWLDDQHNVFQHHKHDWVEFYYYNEALWEMIGKFFHKLFARSNHFGGNRETLQFIKGWISRLFRTYVLLLDRLLQVDAFIIGSTRPEETRRDTPLASRYFKNLNYLLCDPKGLLCSVLVQDYDFDEMTVRASIVETFAEIDGWQHVIQYVRALLQFRPHDQNLGAKLVPCLSTASLISGFALGSRSSSVAPSPRYLTEIFRIVNEPLKQSLDSQLDPLADKRRDIVDSLSKIVIHAAKLDGAVAEEMFEKIVGKPDAALREHYGELVAMVWRMKLMKEYFTKGRMDLRIQGVDQLHAELVVFFQQHKSPDLNNIRSETVSTVLEYLADILLAEKIIEYIVSVESHPQLITRSYNIVGFLVVTNKFSAEQADVVWKTIITSPDPRVVSATLFMLQNIIRNLTKFKEDVYLCKKLMDSPLPLMSPEAHSFFQEFLNITRSRYRNNTGNLDSNLLPPKLCIRLMKQLSATKSQGSGLMVNIYADAAHTLSCLAEQMPLEERIMLYEQCIDTLQCDSMDAAPSVHAIQNIMKNCHGDPVYLASELRIIPAIMDEFCVFVQRTKSARPSIQNARLLDELVPRLDLLLELILLEPSVVQEDRTNILWNHLVGEDAIGSAARDIAWQRLAVFASVRRSSNSFLDRCYANFLPSIMADHFTPCFFEFVQNLTKYKMQAEDPDNENGQDFGIDLIWRVVLTAHPNTGEDSAMQFLAGVYLDKSLVQRISSESVESTHISLADSCLERLKTAHARLRMPKTPQAISDGNAMDITQIQSDRPNQDLVFRRTMSFLTMFLRAIRKRSDFNLQATELVNDIPKVASVIRGQPTTIKYQVLKGGIPAPTKEFVVGELETRKEFHGRVIQIAAAHGLSSFRILWSGTYLNLLEHPMETLGRMSLSKAPLIIREPAHNDPLAYHVPASNQPRTAFEKQIVAQFHDIYELMDNHDMMSKATFDFLSLFPAYSKIQDLVQDDSASPADVFPVDAIFRVLYSLRTLREILQHRVETESFDPPFISHGVRLLESLLTSNIFVDNESFSANDFTLALLSINCLSAFLRESPPIEASPFSSPDSFMGSLIFILQTALKSGHFSNLVSDCYDLILDSALQCNLAWQAFLKHESFEALHHKLLLEYEEQGARTNIWQLIKLKLDRFSPNLHLTKLGFANHIWDLVIRLIPDTIQYYDQCGELFDLACCLLDSNHLELDDKSFTRCFDAWRPFIQEHTHSEVVGKEQVDYVLKGFAALLRRVVQHFPYMDNPPTRGIIESLLELIWSKFLFPSPQPDSDGSLVLGGPMPVVERFTRFELYALAYNLGLVDNQSTCQLMNLAIQPIPDGDAFRTNTIDRSCLLRAPAGYVGLRNLGNTCYMNSLLTQLYMNPGFREFMLHCPLPSNSDPKLLVETQKLFAYMQNSYAKAADATQFTGNIRTLDDEAIDIREQMDVDEFSNTLFMRWEEQMPSNDAKQKLRSFYTGTTVQQIKSSECPHVSERVDTCLAIQCDVQGKSNLSESLQSYIDGDVMEGDNKYKCEQCNGKFVNAVKRTCLKEVPDHLMLQLKRFEYDLSTQRRSKINEYFEFPMAIDMSKYTFNHLENPSKPIEQDMFDLVGVVVHKGQADHGHYVSYIRVRPTSATEGPLWLQFDDADVTTFSPADIGEHCFGGFSNGKETGPLAFQQSPKSFNGYMLFYQRTSTIDTCTWKLSDTSSRKEHVQIPGYLERLVAQDNSTQLEQYNLFSIPHQQFIREVSTKLRDFDHQERTHGVQREMINLLWSHIANITCRIKEQPDFEEIIVTLQKICESCELCCYLMLKWLASQSFELRNFMLKTTQPRVRQHVRVFIYESLLKLRQSADAISLYGIGEDQTPNGVPENSLLSALAGTLSLLAKDELHHNPRAWEDFWGLLAEIAHFGRQERWVMIQQGLLTICLELFMIQCDRDAQATFPRVSEMFRRKIPSHNHLVELVALLLEEVDLSHGASTDDSYTRLRLYNNHSGLLPLTGQEMFFLTDWNREEENLKWISSVFDRWDSSREGPGTTDFYPGEIVHHLLRGQPSIMPYLLQTFVSNIKTLESGFAEPYLRATCQFCQYCPDPDLVREMVTFMNGISALANPINDNEGYNGNWCLAFYQKLFEIFVRDQNKKIEAAFFHEQIIEGVSLWAPALLTFERNYTVGLDALKLLRVVLLKASEETAKIPQDRFEEQRVAAIRKLFRGCAKRARYLLENYPSKTMLNAILSAMKDCRDHLALVMQSEDLADLSEDSDSNLVDQFEVFKNAFEALPLHQHDELAPSSEFTMEWDEVDPADDQFDASELSQSEDELGT